MNYVDSFNLFGTEAAQIPCIKGTGAPTAATEGAVGCFYMNTDNGDVYKCTAVVDGAYAWYSLGNGDSGGSTDAVLYTEQVLTDEQKVQARANIDAAEETEYRHIATYEHPAGLDVKRVEITLDKDGNTFECSEFMIFLTLPTTDEIINDYKTQFHIRRDPSENNYVVLMPQAFSRVADNVRRTRLHLYHVLDGYWATDGTFNDKSNQAGQSVPDVNSSNSGFGNIKTDWVVGKTINSLCFDTVAYMPAGTKIEVYGK